MTEQTRKVKLKPRDAEPEAQPLTPAQLATKQSVNQRKMSPLARTRSGQRVIKPLRPAHTEYR